MNNGKPKEADPYTVYCLCIDMVGSTLSGLKLSTAQFDRFNRALVKQIEPHIDKLELKDALLKFTGDGWLLMTNEGKRVRHFLAWPCLWQTAFRMRCPI